MYETVGEINGVAGGICAGCGLGGGSTFVQVSAAEETSDFAYVVNEDGTATITEVKTNAADVIVRR